MRSFFFLCMSLFLLPLSWAQQNPQYTQYMYNLSIVNPAYSGSKSGLSLGAIYRQQWTGFTGAPKNYSFFIHSPLYKNVGGGVSVVSDKVGPVSETNAFADFSYKLQLSRQHRLSFGLKAGATFHQVALSGLSNPIEDPLFSENVSAMTANIGAGVFFHANTYYAGISIPNLLDAIHLDPMENKLGSTTQHVFFTGGYVFMAGDWLLLKPSFMIKSALSEATTVHTSMNFLLYDRVEAGFSYRFSQSFSAMLNFKFAKKWRIGYAYDRITSDISTVSNASHELFILLDTSADIKKRKARRKKKAIKKQQKKKKVKKKRKSRYLIPRYF